MRKGLGGQWQWQLKGFSAEPCNGIPVGTWSGDCPEHAGLACLFGDVTLGDVVHTTTGWLSSSWSGGPGLSDRLAAD